MSCWKCGAYPAPYEHHFRHFCKECLRAYCCERCEECDGSLSGGAYWYRKLICFECLLVASDRRVVAK